MFLKTHYSEIATINIFLPVPPMSPVSPFHLFLQSSSIFLSIYRFKILCTYDFVIWYFPLQYIMNFFSHAIKYPMIRILKGYMLIYHIFILIYNLSVYIIPFVAVRVVFFFFNQSPILEHVGLFHKFCSCGFVFFFKPSLIISLKSLGIEFLSQRLLSDFKSQGAACISQVTSKRESEL